MRWKEKTKKNEVLGTSYHTRIFELKQQISISDIFHYAKHYGTYDVLNDQGKTLTACITKVSLGYTETQLNILLAILSEIGESLLDTEKNISNKIISSIKDIRSDRHIVQKKLIVFFKIIVHLFYQILLKIGMQ